MLEVLKSIKKTIILCFIISSCLLTGCENSKDEKEISFEDTLNGDNSLDKYSYVVNKLLKFEEPSDAIAGGARSVFLSDKGGYFYKKVVHEDYTKDYETITYAGKEREFSLKPDTSGDNKTLWGGGFVAGSDDYLTFNITGKPDENLSYIIERYDFEGRTILSVNTDLDRLNEVFLPVLAMDDTGMIHLVRCNGYTVYYYLIGSDGQIEYKKTYEDTFFYGLAELPNGNIAIEITPLVNGRGFECALEVCDLKNNRMQTVKNWNFFEHSKKVSEKNPNADGAGTPLAFNMFDDRRLIAANINGAYIVDTEQQEDILLYEWSNHGISPSEVYCIKADEEQNIYLLYGDEEGINYLMLSPTKEEKPVKKILFAVSELNKRKYMNAVAKFNKKHPLYIISMREYQYSEKDRLIAKITSGDGAVLVDTSLVGFLQMGDLWEPLDDCFADSESAEFNESALSLGMIDDKLCGVVTDFYIDTIFASEKINSMDYDSFLSELGTYNGDKTLFDFYGKEGIEEFVLGYLCRTAEDCYYFTDGMFDAEKFREAVRYAEKYVPDDERNGFYSKDDSVALFNESYIDNVAQIELNRLKFGGDIKYVGLPGVNGGNHYLVGSQPIALRTNATAEEKTIAKEFIESLVSYETQRTMSRQYEYGLSIRKDVLDEQIAGMEDYLYEELMASGLNADTVIKEIDTEKAAVELKNIINSAQVTSEKFWEYRRIISEELEAYLYDRQSMDEMLDHLKSRVNIYMEEKK